MKAQPVIVSGAGFACCLGATAAAVKESLLELRHGLSPLPWLERLETGPKVGGFPRDFNLSSPDPSDRPYPDGWDPDPALLRSMPPAGTYGAYALDQALGEAGLSAGQIATARCGLYTANSGSPSRMRSHFEALAESGWRRAHPLGVLQSVAGAMNFALSAALRVTGGVCGFTSACASGSHALGFAFDAIAAGRQDLMLVVAAEELSLESLLPFDGLGALTHNADPDTASRPFDRARDGFVGSAGGAALILESEDHARRRGFAGRVEMSGWAEACDGYHSVAPEPCGRGLQRAVERVLEDHALPPSEIDYVNAHAASTPAGDAAEASALRRVFGEGGTQPVISSTKALTGHGLAMTGLLEAAFCVLAMREGFMPGQAHLREPDTVCAGLRIPTRSVNEPPTRVLNLSSGFGGANVVHLFQTL